MDLTDRARIHAALGDPSRLAIVDELGRSDRTFQELARLTGLPSNAAAHHLNVLESAGLVERHASEGDRRRRYLTLRPLALDALIPDVGPSPSNVLFVCTHNSARSPFAAALWSARTGGRADSAGAHPAARVHPDAVRVAYGVRYRPLRLGSERLRERGRPPDLIVSVCDRAREGGTPFDVPSVHWSIPDPVAAGTGAAFRSAFAALADRIDRLALTGTAT